MRRGAVAAVVLVASLLCGCAATSRIGRVELPGGAPRSAELRDVPFHPQDEFQCGPAALATVLGASGVAVAPGSLVAETYLPGRKGSLQAELGASARRHGRMPYPLEPSLAALLAEIAAGRPVLVLQKQGFGPWPGWHYAVVVGYDLDRRRLVLRSGRERRAIESLRLFDLTWTRAGRWATVLLRPGELPENPDPGRFMQAAAALEAVGRRADARDAYLAAERRWPAAALPQLGLGNLAAAADDWPEAEQRFGAAARLDPGSAGALNNHATALLHLGCAQAARVQAERARAAAGSGPLAANVARTLEDIRTRGSTPDGAGCPAPP